MEESARKSTWDVNAKEMTQTPPFEIAIVIDTKEAENKREVSNHPSTAVQICNESLSTYVVVRGEGLNFSLLTILDGPWMQEVGDPVRHLFTALTNAGLVVEKEEGVNYLVFLKVKELTQT